MVLREEEREHIYVWYLGQFPVQASRTVYVTQTTFRYGNSDDTVLKRRLTYIQCLYLGELGNIDL